VIDYVPDTPRTKQKDNAPPFFRFYPLVPKERDTYRLLQTIRNGMTGYRIAKTMPGAVSVCDRNPNAAGEGFRFPPDDANRVTSARSTARRLNHLLQAAGIKHDPFTNHDHTVYSMRKTATCMQIILSEGQVNIFNLTKNAGTSVGRIARFYARNLPICAGMARILQSFGGER